MANQAKVIYLGKKGKIHGPLSEQELERISLSGEIENFTYLWDSNSKAWRNIEPPPPTPGTKAADDSPSWSRIAAVCHNFNSVVTGMLENITDNGCDLVSRDHSASPRLGLKSSLVLNVIDSSRAKSMNVKASLSDVSRNQEGWVYHLRWAHRPAF